jgi:hypothetical protein
MYHSWLLKRRMAPAWPVRFGFADHIGVVEGGVDIRGRDNTLGDEALDVITHVQARTTDDGVCMRPPRRAQSSRLQYSKISTAIKSIVYLFQSAASYGDACAMSGIGAAARARKVSRSCGP